MNRLPRGAQAPPALVAIFYVQMQITRVLLVFRDPVKGTRVDDLF
jgi:hypothetical protein